MTQSDKKGAYTLSNCVTAVDPNFKRLKGIPLKFSQAIAILHITIWLLVFGVKNALVYTVQKVSYKLLKFEKWKGYKSLFVRLRNILENQS